MPNEDLVVELVRRQREVARRHGETEVIARQTAWLVENGYEDANTTWPSAWLITTGENQDRAPIAVVRGTAAQAEGWAWRWTLDNPDTLTGPASVAGLIEFVNLTDGTFPPATDSAAAADDETTPEPSEVCDFSRRPDQAHSWRFDGDDPYVICVYCDEMRDAHRPRVIRAGRRRVAEPSTTTANPQPANTSPLT